MHTAPKSEAKETYSAPTKVLNRGKEEAFILICLSLLPSDFFICSSNLSFHGLTLCLKQTPPGLHSPPPLPLLGPVFKVSPHINDVYTMHTVE